ncbi:protein FAM110B [Larimichthys crocea]|uniref:protein FAM110B n=1 Tax=Larimichthys crocea TaxID=215358 RepID=UPI000F600FFA|nr:protein FAM110A [Larimichthys crocea]XP_019108881.2 protein FAM110A [Larimichthys crocea]XP_019108882.2 protein FAM110A [Larimichthys crocea]XP_027144437.1 protein FAM110A [Larimichthys crocea]XP_027144439.1 protein FAM110A [Larimichthys crocea]XP_027144440.1 protein FAM110A [Larimichthys crocea]
MPVETLRPSDGRLAGVPFTSAMPFRILNKGPDYFRRQAEPGARKLSAVERLEADKAKYVKSQQVALNRQAPIKPPIIRKPLVPPGMMLQNQISTPPARKVPRCPADVENGGGREGPGRRRPALNLDILNNLINDVCDGPMPCSQSSSSTSPSSSSPSSGAKSIGSSLSAEQERSSRLLNSPKPLNHGIINSSSTSSCTSSPLNNLRTPAADPTRRPPPVPARAPRIGVPAPYSSPNSVTVRRVDVRPQAEIRKPQRAQLQPQLRPRQTAQGQVAHPQVPPPPPPQSSPHTQLNNPSQTLPPSPAYPPPSPMLVRTGMIPPASPAFTRISNASSKGSARKHPSLHRSKSDLSDRYSRATADMERFFNYCGLDPEEVEGMGGVERFTRANSDIVSISKLRSVSTPSSEADRAREDGGDEDNEDGPAAANDRVPYGISVIERNARVIKWLYGIRQARDTNNGVSNV